MQLTAEITMYPLQDVYIPPIQKVIAKLNHFDGLSVQTFQSATIVTGDHDTVMDSLKDMMRWSVEECGKAVFVTKFLPNTDLLDQ